MAISCCYWHLVVKNDSFTLLHCYWHPVGHEWQFHIATDVQWSGMVNFTLLLMSIGQEWQFHIATDVQWSTNGSFTLLLTCRGQEMAILHLLLTSSEVKNGNFTICYWHLMQSRMAISPSYWHLAIKNGSFILLLTSKVLKNGSFILLLTSRGQEWQFHIASDVQWSRLATLHCYRCPVIKNGQFHIAIEI